jgi:hypothetical protein
LFLAFASDRRLESPALTLVPSLFYIRLISLTAGTLVYLFLLALILGHRRPRLFERVLFFLFLSLFLIYAGGLLEINAFMEYGGFRMPEATRLFYEGRFFCSRWCGMRTSRTGGRFEWHLPGFLADPSS